MPKFETTHYTLEYPYQRTTGPVTGPFLTGLRDGKLLGIRSGSRVLCPPLEFDPDTFEELEPDFVEVFSRIVRVDEDDQEFGPVRMAASFSRFAKSAPESTGVPRARTATSTLSSKLILRACTRSCNDPRLVRPRECMQLVRKCRIG